MKNKVEPELLKHNRHCVAIYQVSQDGMRVAINGSDRRNAIMLAQALSKNAKLRDLLEQACEIHEKRNG